MVTDRQFIFLFTYKKVHFIKKEHTLDTNQTISSILTESTPWKRLQSANTRSERATGSTTGKANSEAAGRTAGKAAKSTAEKAAKTAGGAKEDLRGTL